MRTIYYRKSIDLIVLSSASCLILSSPCSYAQGAPDASNVFESFAANRKTVLSQVKAFEITGTTKVTVADAYWQAIGGPKVMKRNFAVLGKGDKVKEIVESLDESGKVGQIDTYFLNSKQVTVTDNRPRRMARIFALERSPNVGLFNECPAFLEYSFLGISIRNAGIPALLPSDLASTTRWGNVGKCLQSVIAGENNLLHARLDGDDGYSVVDFLTPTDSGKGYQISAVSFFRKDNSLDRKIEVLETSPDNVLGDLGKRFKISVYSSGPSPMLQAVWEMEIKSVKLNSPIDDDAVSFDPTSVDVIYDGDNKVFINVPK